MSTLEGLATEQRNPASALIDAVSTEDALHILNREDHKAVAAVEAEIPRIARALEAIHERYARGGRLFYVGAGTSGRLGVLDAAECPPTFGVEPDRVQALIAGGREAMFEAVEGAEDDRAAGAGDLRERGLTAADSLVGIASSGRTPYVLGAVEYARSIGALTVGLSSNPGSELERAAELAITPAVGPEAIAGSTRLKSGTAQKLVLNMLSTGLMIKMGYVHGNQMINLKPANRKLVERARRIVRAIAGCTPDQARRALEASGGRIPPAVLMARFSLSRDEAEQRLNAAGGSLRRALESGA